MTAVEWLIQTIQRNGFIMFATDNEIEQAKQMEKEQSEKYAEFSVLSDRRGLPLLNWESYIKPFNETFKNTEK